MKNKMTYQELVFLSNSKKVLESLNGLVMVLMKAIVTDWPESEWDFSNPVLMTSMSLTSCLRNMETKRDSAG